jgi:negative regulator of sigma E activity
MFCEHYQRAIGDSLVADVELPRELHAHADSCSACRAALEAERALFSAIDASIRERVNEVPPPGLIAGVRARLTNEPVTRRRLFPVWVAALSMAAVALGVGLLLRPSRVPSGGLPENSSPVAHNVPPVGTGPSGALPPEKIAPPGRATQRPGPSITPSRPPAQVLDAEVLVPQEDRLALALLVRRLGQPGSPQNSALAASLLDPKELKPIADLQIPQLEVKPLASGSSESGDGER